MERVFVWFGESAFLVEPLPGEDRHALAAVLRGLPGAEDVLPGARILVRCSEGSAGDAANALVSIPLCRPTKRRLRVIGIPVALDGPDLEEVASRCSLTPRELAEMLTQTELEVAYLGFSPGFAYMTGLPPVLERVPRRANPRTSVKAGSVALAGGYLGIYPQESPGGWSVVGRTGMVMFDPQTPPYSALQPGDRVRLIVSGEPLEVPRDDAAERPRSDAPRRVVLEDPGTLTTLQDLGRRGVGQLGVPRAGPADRDMMRLANLIAGNRADSGVLETTFEGPGLRFAQESYVVVVGAPVTVNGRSLETGTVLLLAAGDLLEVGTASGVHAYVAVAGGILGPELFGSCSSDLLSGLGTGPLHAGDQLGLGEAGHPRGYAPSPERPPVVRVQPGPDPFSEALLDELVSEPYTVSAQSNRVGVRLGGRRVTSDAAVSSRSSYGMVEGAVQLPPSGEPIVLLCDHATLGGYPVVATVISADIGNVAQRRPGEAVRLELVDRQAALAARGEVDRVLQRAPKGNYPTSPV